MTAHDPLHADRARASSFGANAALYHATRPRYPAAFLDDVLAGAGRDVLDVGCGTGILGAALAERGAVVLGVEPDAQMAAVARDLGLDVDVATFEGWDAAGRTFDVLVAGQAWHWVDPVAGAHKAAQVVRPGGRVAHAWNIPSFDDNLRASLDAVYERLATGRAQPTVPHRRRDGHQHDSERALVATGAFEPPSHPEYEYDQRYSTAEWLAQLETHSDHHLLPDDDRARLLAAVGAAIDEHGGSFVMHYVCEVTLFTRR